MAVTIFGPEDEQNMFLRKSGIYLKFYDAAKPRNNIDENQANNYTCKRIIVRHT
jgi:hypothetical protein